MTNIVTACGIQIDIDPDGSVRVTSSDGLCSAQVYAEAIFVSGENIIEDEDSEHICDECAAEHEAEAAIDHSVN